MRAIAQLARNAWEDAAVTDKRKEIEGLALGEVCASAMGYLQVDAQPACLGLTMLMDDRLLHFPIAVWPRKATGEEGVVAINLDDVVEVGRVGFWFIFRSPRRARASLRLLLRDGTSWSLAVSDPDMKRSIADRVA